MFHTYAANTGIDIVFVQGKVNIDRVVLKWLNISFRKVCVQDALGYLAVRILILLEI